MTSEEKDLLIRLAPAYILAAAYGVYTFFRVRAINREREQGTIEHETRLADLKVAGNERIERFHAWRASQPNLEQILEKAAKDAGSIEDVRSKMEDPNYVWKI